MPKQSKFSTTMTIELLFIMENIWNYGEKFSEREREKKRKREQSTYNQQYSSQVVQNIHQPTRIYTFNLDPIILC